MAKYLIALALFYSLSYASQAQTINSAEVLSRKQVPILCYHQIRDWRKSDKKVDKDYIIPPATFKAHIKMLADSGYHTILPDQLFDYLTKGTPLPAKPVMLTFDDTDGDQFTVARSELMKYGFKGVYFIVFTNINKNKYYMTRAQIRQLSDEGNVIACHTQDHTNFKKYTDKDWEPQIGTPTKKLERLTGKPVNYFAFPFGEWSSAGLPKLRSYGFKAAFQLSLPRDHNDPLMTIRRILSCGYWTAETLDYNIKHDFGRAQLRLVSNAKAKPEPAPVVK
ncbi:polysaccharide deacetylase [Mucilaginibacter sp. PPCGB 2223]|uniref:polysaccharide deacetylase family protein n=1 Tax=Mucilaginibacter sp. PPCGB 2223 TaxID=1886027 RepID=UPI000825133F|nr:polysaccharide deacetylase family protein [Mucilaginibacter sp. PPCGB 2223]OCX53250.1 polysaccharide deacetylase [Mucilaginibacter sp. PPCGB 2223]